MRATWFFLWKIRNCPLDTLIPALRLANAKGVCIKLQDGTLRYNLYDANGNYSGNDSYLTEYIYILESEGFDVGGWSWYYPLPTLMPESQASLSAMLIQKYNLKWWKADCEQYTNLGSYWKVLADGVTPNPYRKTSATRLMNALPSVADTQTDYALTSYRYIQYHQLFPFSEFVNHAKHGTVSQQLYWEGAHNPRSQLLESIRQYRNINPNSLFSPAGSAYATSVWSPTADDLVEFAVACQDTGCVGWGFWSIDYILSKNKTEWLEAIGSVSTTSPPPPPSNEVWLEIQRERYNIRNASYPLGEMPISSDIGDLHNGRHVKAIDEEPDENGNYHVEAYIYKDGVKKL